VNDIYFSRGTNGAPNCGSADHFPARSSCDAASAAMVNIGGSGVWPGLGNPSARAAQYRRSLQDGSWGWRSIRNETDFIECLADDGIHGETAASSKKWIGSPADGGPWISASLNRWSSISNTYRFYTANYLNYLAGPGTAVMTRLQIVRDVAINLASSLQNVNLGLMRYSEDAQGGYVLQPVDNIATNRTAILNTLNGFDPYDGSGGTPLSETYYEAALYLQGKTWDFGSVSTPGKSVAGSMATSDTYNSPIKLSCQKNYVVYLTDGAPTRDADAIGKIETMIGKSCANQVEPFHDGGWVTGSGICMDELAAWMADDKNTDLQTNATVPGNQNALTYMIGFGDSLTASLPYLNAIASAGGTGKAYTAGDVPTLTAALQTIFSELQEDSATFVTPSISVNAFNRAQTDTDLFFSLFKVGKREHWDGNLKKYKLLNNKIVDKNDLDAVDPASGFFSQGSWSIWSPAKDGADVAAGGAASKLDTPDLRKIYTSVAGNDLTLTGNAVTIANMTDVLVGTGSGATCGTACQDVVNWARGYDIDDENGDSSKTDQIKFMGDPMHGRPAVISYGKTSGTPQESNTVVYVPTNDGFLHAISGPTSGGGEELWAFVPPELLNRLGTLSSKSNAPHTYGLDGDIRVLKLDKNQNGLVDGDDYVYLFFGMRGGGNRYYSLDVTDRTKPKLLWNIGAAELPGVGQTWSPPVVTRVNVSSGNTDTEKFVLIFGGGYDTTQESQAYSTDTVGNRIYMVEAKTGTLLWSAGGPGSAPAPDLLFDASGKEMNNSIPGRITVIDTNGDQFADRLYAADMGGRVWRFDIFNGERRDKLVTGGIIATLGAGGISPAPAASENRRFYNAPDVALVQFRGIEPYYNIAIGSGYRGHPLDTTTVERFYSVRDKAPYAQLSQTEYNAITPVKDGDLVDITSDPAGTTVTTAAKGWKLTMSGNGPGEKILAESTTVNNVILFTSFEPDSLGGAGPCYPSTTNRAYAVTAFAGKPALDFNDDKTTDNNDLFTDLNQQGIVGDVNIALIRQGDTDPNSPTSPPTVCLAGMEVLKKCVNAGGTVRTFWNRVDAQ
jgi:type IV pilus assembly protein PilY1